MTFKTGDKVRYNGQDPFVFAPPGLGTIVEYPTDHGDDVADVRFDNVDSPDQYIETQFLTRI